MMTQRRPKTIHFWRGDLPHWQVEDGRYFVTIHLHGAIPPKGKRRIRRLAEKFRALPESMMLSDRGLKLGRQIFKEMERWLDRLTNVRHLVQPSMAEMVIEAIMHRQKRGIWEMFEYVVMPSHIHLFFELDNQLSLKRELIGFKRWTGRRAAQIDSQLRGHRFWQTEWFDHWSRSDEEDDRIIKYIRMNPVKANLVDRFELWTYGSWSGKASRE